jgi:hypothetical protein
VDLTESEPEDDEDEEDDEDVEDTAESGPDSLARASIVAGEYMYEDYVDYENDVEYRYAEVASGYERHEAVVEVEADAEDEAVVEAEAVGADAEVGAEVDVKRKGGSRKGRGVAAASSSR